MAIVRAHHKALAGRAALLPSGARSDFTLHFVLVNRSGALAPLPGTEGWFRPIISVADDEIFT